VATGVRDLHSSLDRALIERAGPRLSTRLRVFLRRRSLDHRLADGAAPQSSPELELRARQLVSRADRSRIAESIDRLLAEARSGARSRWSSAVPVDRGAIAAAAPLLSRIAAVLELEGPIYCQGVAMLETMLRDGASAIYGRGGERALSAQLERVIAALEGR
jgi:hypothetical protein